MKNLFVVLVLFVQATLFMGCLEMEALEPQPQVDENGLTSEITDLVPEYILETMDSLGMPIHGGANPPSLEGTFLGKPYVLLSSNFPDVDPGHIWGPLYLAFSEQDNSKLRIQVDYQTGPEQGKGFGSYIVGDGCQFSVFEEVNVTHTNGAEATAVMVISGCLESEVIHDLHVAGFMLDDHGHSGTWIKNGQGRLSFDQDGISEMIDEENIFQDDEGLQSGFTLGKLLSSNPNQ
jgi:hypothetical protein